MEVPGLTLLKLLSFLEALIGWDPSRRPWQNGFVSQNAHFGGSKKMGLFRNLPILGGATASPASSLPGEGVP